MNPKQQLERSFIFLYNLKLKRNSNYQYFTPNPYSKIYSNYSFNDQLI